MLNQSSPLGLMVAQFATGNCNSNQKRIRTQSAARIIRRRPSLGAAAAACTSRHKRMASWHLLLDGQRPWCGAGPAGRLDRAGTPPAAPKLSAAHRGRPGRARPRRVSQEGQAAVCWSRAEWPAQLGRVWLSGGGGSGGGLANTCTSSPSIRPQLPILLLTARPQQHQAHLR